MIDIEASDESESSRLQQLHPNHDLLIRASAIAPGVACERGYQSVTSKAVLMEHGFTRSQAQVPALLIPIRDMSGTIALRQMRPDQPRTDRAGRVRKYETPKGARLCLDVPVRIRPLLANPKIPLWITEGARKVDSAVSQGLCCIGVLGVWGWSCTNQHGGKTAIGDWRDIALNQREVLIAFDSDISSKTEVARALMEMKRYLESRGARVRVIYMPALKNGGKRGLDDHFATGGTVGQLVSYAEDSVRATKRKVVSLNSAHEGSKARILIPGAHPSEDLDGQELEVGTDEFAKSVVAALPRDQVYRLGDDLVTFVGAIGALSVKPVDISMLRCVIDRNVALVERRLIKKDGQELIVECFHPCNEDRAKIVRAALLAASDLRELSLFVNYPVFLSSCDLAKAGWNAVDGVYYDRPPELEQMPVSYERPLEVLSDLVVDTPFADRASRHNLISMMLTRILRPAIKGCVPFTVVTASVERSGKGKLISCALGRAIIGKPVEVMPYQLAEEERDKRILSLLRGQDQIVHIDNVPVGMTVDSACLAALATCDFYKGRVLGVSNCVTLPNRLLVVFSGNNLAASSEILKRSVPIMLEPKTANPERRKKFKHSSFEFYASERRPLVLAALIALVEAWKSAGRPSGNMPFGGFEEWARIVGGVMKVAGATAWLKNLKSWIESEDETGRAERFFVAEWLATFAEKPVTATELWTLAKALNLFSELRQGPAEGQVATFSRRILRKMLNQTHGKHRIRGESYGGSTRYKLVPSRKRVSSKSPQDSSAE